MINSVFEEAKLNNKKVFIPYYTAGYPSIAKSQKAFLQLAKSGAGLLEVGIPFSDPLADGPTIQEASTKALASGLKINQVFDSITQIKDKLPPTIIMTYYNLLYSNGLKNFARKAAKAGVKGLIIPDLPIDEANEWLKASQDHVETIFLVAPTSSDERIKRIANATTSFIYCVSLTGVTGARNTLPSDVTVFLKRVRRITDKYLALGFGISTKEHVKQISPHVDGIIIGSAIIKAYNGGKTEKESLKQVDKLCNRLNI